MSRHSYSRDIIALLHFNSSTGASNTLRDEIGTEQWAFRRKTADKSFALKCYGKKYNWCWGMIHDSDGLNEGDVFPNQWQMWSSSLQRQVKISEADRQAIVFSEDDPVRQEPKFGECAAYTRTGDDIHNPDKENPIECTNASGMWNITGAPLEIEFFLKPFAAEEGRIFAFEDTSGEFLSCRMTEDREIKVACGGSEITATAKLINNTWNHLRFQYGTGNMRIWLNGQIAGSGSIHGTYSVTKFILGGLNGFFDEFVARNKFTPDAECSKVPEQEYEGTADIKSFGGFGNGALGNVTITQDCRINSYAAVRAVSGTRLTVSSWSKGLFGEPSKGDEVMILVCDAVNPYQTDKLPQTEPLQLTYSDETGKYAFRKIAAVSQNYITLDSAVKEEFNLEQDIAGHFIQVITVPNFARLTVEQGATVTPLLYDPDTGGGVVAFRCRGDAVIQGKIITMRYGKYRLDKIPVDHTELIDHFVFCSGGGIFMTCGGKFTASHEARIGAEWDGAAGMPSGGSADGRALPGGAGWGGEGGGFTRGSLRYHACPPMMGAGGEGFLNYQLYTGDIYPLGNLRHFCQYPNGERVLTIPNYLWNWSVMYGAHRGWDSFPMPEEALHSNNPTSAIDFSETAAASGGANIILICTTLNADESAVSTGGEGGIGHGLSLPYRDTKTGGAYGGGGSGLCYIACKEMI